ncbi:class I SAM-dependent methyltransferase [Ktedonobacter robiniae]|uniref:Type 11 methyltransferase n=1 Tax=Ktedonobacter robiniae TaxID=2778365 RepID=A0ABQ3UPQ3_9CHLR|nr:class I SAM-dependent methyltransferase [Ktedonobacter robiniae]GHO54660.1 type 11 methyltransferase [Ktedonobacter robiniae]
MSSFNFDMLASIYDATRGYPRDVALRIAQSLDEASSAGPQTRFLEIGVGTGRIALPLANLGRDLTGIDISERMLARLEHKLRAEDWQEERLAWGELPDEQGQPQPAWGKRFQRTEPDAHMRIAVADVHHLPFAAASFEVIVAVHVLHLVDDWRQVLQEVRRVATPDGMFLHCGDEHGPSDVQEVRAQWRRVLAELGYDEQRLYQPSDADLQLACAELGWQAERWIALTWERAITPRQVLEGILQRNWSSMRRVPDAVFQEGCRRLEQWAYAYFGAGIDTVRKQEQRFIITRYCAQLQNQ